MRPVRLLFCSLVVLAAACSGSADAGSAPDATLDPVDSQRSSGGTGSSDDDASTTAITPQVASSTLESTTTIEPRSDGIQLVFADGALGPAELGSTIDEVAAALGPAYTITPEETIRVGFSSGYSISQDGEVLFWAVEEDGELPLFMTNNPRVGLDSGLRPRLSLAEAIELHGEPALTLGTESREFVTFDDGTGSASSLSILVAIGQFGGPVGVYDGSEPDDGELPQADGYQLEEANIKELWFSAASVGG